MAVAITALVQSPHNDKKLGKIIMIIEKVKFFYLQQECKQEKDFWYRRHPINNI